MIARRYRYVHPSAVDPSTLDGGEASDNSYATAQSQTDGSGVVLPWWPTQGQQPEPYYHASVQLPDGRLALVVDVGAWTNLTGSKFAREQASRAAAAGRKPSASKLAKPLRVQGVGSGTPETTWQCELPIAIPDGSGRAFDHIYTAPTLQGAGEDLPALLGMKTITEHEGVLECGRGKERLTFPGPGGYTINWALGALHMPLERAPSGHVVIPCDDFASVASSSTGLPSRTLQLHATESQPLSSSDASHTGGAGISHNLE